MKKQKDKEIVEEKKLIKENSKDSNHEEYEEEGLEEQIEKIEELTDDVQFQEFLKPLVKSSTPVLERIAGELPQPVFVDTGSQSDFEEDKKNKINYDANKISDYVTGDDKILKKQDYEFIQQPANMNVRGIREDLNNKGQKFLVNNSLDLRAHDSGLETKYVEPERVSREDSRLPFEGAEKKYKRIR